MNLTKDLLNCCKSFIYFIQRVERVSINPEILILRSIVLEKDMEYLKEIALTKVFHLHSYFNF